MVVTGGLPTILQVLHLPPCPCVALVPKEPCSWLMVVEWYVPAPKDSWISIRFAWE